MKEELNILKELKGFLINLSKLGFNKDKHMETKLEDLPLADGMTVIQADSFEEGQAVFIVGPEGSLVELEPGTYELADGRVLTVEVVGIIATIGMVEEEAEPVEPTEVPVEAEKVQQQTTAKKIVRSTVEEQHFSKVEELESKVAELEAKILELSKVEVVAAEIKEVVELEEVKPIKHNPEKKEVINLDAMTSLEKHRLFKSRMNG
jgi:hypothetical protein